LSGEIAELFNVEAIGVFSNHLALIIKHADVSEMEHDCNSIVLTMHHIQVYTARFFFPQHSSGYVTLRLFFYSDAMFENLPPHSFGS